MVGFERKKGRSWIWKCLVLGWLVGFESSVCFGFVWLYGRSRSWLETKGFLLLGSTHVSPRRPDYWSRPTRAPPWTRTPHGRLWTRLHDCWQVPHHGAFLSLRLRYSKELRPQPTSLPGCKSPLPSPGFILSECVSECVAPV